MAIKLPAAVLLTTSVKNLPRIFTVPQWLKRSGGVPKDVAMRRKVRGAGSAQAVISRFSTVEN
jgi:hypothetical protein